MRNLITRLWSLIVFTAYIAGGKALMACATCSKTFSQEKVTAYKISTALLAFLPFLILGLITFYVVRKSKARKLSEEDR